VIISTSQIIAAEERERLSAHAVAVLGKDRLGAEGGENEVRAALRAANVVTR
jgi:hypothetical protein